MILLAGVVAGWTALSAALVTIASASGLLAIGVIAAAVGGAALTNTVIFLARQRQRRALAAAAVGGVLAVVVCALLLQLVVLGATLIALAVGSGALLAIRRASGRGLIASGAGAVVGLALVAAPPAQAWEVKTHVLVVEQAAVILRADGHADVADLLASTAAPPLDAVAAAGRTKGGGQPTTYQGWLDQGADDADHRVKKTLAPDHFFNWWTRSGKGLVAGGSSATTAEKQFDDAVRLWAAGDRSGSMFHLGIATHLVGDACTPPHQFFLVPAHREFEKLIGSRHDTLKVASGGIYQADLAGASPRGGEQWSTQHTRGWVDECARRGVTYTLAATQPAPPAPGLAVPALSAETQVGDAQRLSAGYLMFFFDTVGGP